MNIIRLCVWPSELNEHYCDIKLCVWPLELDKPDWHGDCVFDPQRWMNMTDMETVCLTLRSGWTWLTWCLCVWPSELDEHDWRGDCVWPSELDECDWHEDCAWPLELKKPDWHGDCVFDPQSWMNVTDMKTVCLTLRAGYIIMGIALSYFCDCLQLYLHSCTLRSASDTLSLQIPRTRLSTVGSCAFSVFGPSAWNDLPLRQKPSLDSFKCNLKTFLFPKP